MCKGKRPGWQTSYVNGPLAIFSGASPMASRSFSCTTDLATSSAEAPDSTMASMIFCCISSEVKPEKQVL